MPEPPPIEKIIERFRAAVDILLLNDDDLLIRNVAERAITHKLGEYLRPHFQEWNVDCEYNRNGNEAKQISYRDKNGNTKYAKIYPDIIVHERGTNDCNLLAIEAKKHNCSSNEEKRDKDKLEAYATQVFHYKIGIFVTFYVGKNHSRKYKFQCYYKHDDYNHAWHDENGQPIN